MVSGVPRSGTSLVMQMLAAGGFPLLTDETRPPDIHNPRGYLEYAPARALRRDASWLPRARGAAVKVIHALVRALPRDFEYRLVLVRRDLREVVASQEAMAPRSQEGGLSPERLAAIFEAQLAEPRRAAGELASFLGGGLDPGAMAGAVDPALYRQKR